MRKERDHVGYGKPPVHSRFKKGRSGNPKGRPKGSKNFKTDLAEELEEKIPIREGSQSKRLTKQRALIKTVMNRALKGDVRAAEVLVKWLVSDHKTSNSGNNEPLSSDDSSLLANIEARLLSQNVTGRDKLDCTDSKSK